MSYDSKGVNFSDPNIQIPLLNSPPFSALSSISISTSSKRKRTRSIEFSDSVSYFNPQDESDYQCNDDIPESISKKLRLSEDVQSGISTTFQQKLAERSVNYWVLGGQLEQNQMIPPCLSDTCVSRDHEDRTNGGAESENEGSESLSSEDEDMTGTEEEEEESSEDEVESEDEMTIELKEGEQVVRLMAASFLIPKVLIKLQSGESLDPYWASDPKIGIQYFTTSPRLKALKRISTYSLHPYSYSHSLQFSQFQEALEYNSIQGLSIQPDHYFLIKSLKNENDKASQIVVEVFENPRLATEEEIDLNAEENSLIESQIWIDFLVSRTEARIVSSMKHNIRNNHYYIFCSPLSSPSCTSQPLPDTIQKSETAEQTQQRDKDILSIQSVLTYYGGTETTDPLSDSCRYVLIHATSLPHLSGLPKLIDIKNRDSVKFVVFGKHPTLPTSAGFFSEVLPLKRGIITIDESMLTALTQSSGGNRVEVIGMLRRIVQFVEHQNELIINPEDPPRWVIYLNTSSYDVCSSGLGMAPCRSDSISTVNETDIDTEEDDDDDECEVIRPIQLFREEKMDELSLYKITKSNAQYLQSYMNEYKWISNYRYFVYLCHQQEKSQKPENGDQGVYYLDPSEFLNLFDT